MSEELFLIEKHGYYYRPDAQGYTGMKSEAGRYSFEEAVERVGPNGPDGPQDGLGMWREADAPEYSSRCPWDVRMKAEAYKARFSAGKASRPEPSVQEAARIVASHLDRSPSPCGIAQIIAEKYGILCALRALAERGE